MTDQLKMEPIGKEKKDELAGQGGVIEREKQTAGRNQFQNQHRRHLRK